MWVKPTLVGAGLYSFLPAPDLSLGLARIILSDINWAPIVATLPSKT